MALAGHRTKRATLRELARLVNASSPGRLADQLARLRELGLVGYTAQRGRLGSTRWWFHPKMRAGIARAPRRRHRLPVNDSISPYGGFLTRATYAREAAAASSSGSPPGPPGRFRRTGPRRGRPPRILYGHCPSGHLARTGRRSWSEYRGALHGEYRGRCGRCRATFTETIDVAASAQLALPVLRGPAAWHIRSELESIGRRYLDGRDPWGRVPALPRSGPTESPPNLPPVWRGR
jgi:hypothetical protein